MEKKKTTKTKQNYVQETNKQNGEKKKKKYKKNCRYKMPQGILHLGGEREKRKKKNAEVEHVNTKKASKLQTGGSKSH